MRRMVDCFIDGGRGDPDGAEPTCSGAAGRKSRQADGAEQARANNSFGRGGRPWRDGAASFVRSQLRASFQTSSTSMKFIPA